MGSPVSPFGIAERGGEDGGQLVIISGGDGIELVIVAAGASDRQTQESLRGHVDLIVDHVIALQRKILLGESLFAERQEAGGDDAAIAHAGVRVGRENVAGQLLAHELVVRHVVIEGLHDVVAIAPGVGIAVVFVAAGGIGITHDVEPVPPPALAVTGRSQQAVDHLLKSLGRFVGEEILQLLFGGRKAGQIESGAAEQRGFIGRRRGLETVLFEVGENELVDGVQRPNPSVWEWAARPARWA